MEQIDFLWFPYIKPDGEEYDGFWGKNGFYNFEVGYIKIDEDGCITDKKILSKSCDSIMFDQKCLLPMFDCVEGFHIRIHGDHIFKWRNDLVLSTAVLTTGVPLVKEADE